MVQDRAIHTVASQWKVIYCLSNSAIFHDLGRPLTQFSRSHRSLMLDISQTARHSHRYYKMRTGNHTKAFERYHFQLP